jgi:tRNA A-37 threonylcarbamoyl transferase component Bud32
MKTLGIKFQVAGVKEAQASLNGLKAGVDEALNSNKKAIADYQRDVKRGWRERTGAVLGVSPKLSGASPMSDQFKTWKIENFGTTAQKQNLSIARDRSEFTQRTTYRGLNNNTRNQILEFRFLFKEFLLDLKKLVNEDLKDVLQETVGEVSEKKSSFEKISSVATLPFKAAAAGIVSPIQAIIFGALNKIGSELVRDFSEGVASQMQKNLGLQFKEVGQDIGGAVGSSMYLAYEKILTATRNSVIDRHPVSGSNETLHLQKLLDDLGQVLQGFGLSLAAIPIKVKKRIDIDKKAIPQVKERAGELMINRKLTEAQEKEIDASKSITILTGGASYDPEAGTTDFAYRTLQPMLRGSYVHPVKNLFSNAQGTAEFDRVFGEAIAIGMSNENTRAALLQFAKNNANVDESKDPITDEELEAIFDGDAAEVSQKITDFFKKISLPLPKILEVVFNGYNPDDIAMAAEGIFFKEKYPDKPLQFVGTSFGGFNAAASAEMMNRLGYDDVKAVGVTTPLVGMESTVNPDNYMSSIGDLDFLYEMTLGGIFKGKVPKPDNLQVVPGQGKGHLLGHFLAQSEEFRNSLQHFLKGRVDVPSMEEYQGKEVMAMGRIGSNNAESALVRTIKKNLGEKYDEGYTFNAEDLIGHRDNLLYMAGGRDLKKIKNANLKEFYQDYIEFLDTLAQELETIEKFEQVGKKFKPVNSLRKAANFYPDLGHFIPNHPDFKMTQDEFAATNAEVEKNKSLVEFKRKIGNETPNIERTYRSMLGEDISKKGYGYYDEKEYQVRANEHLGGLINYLETEVLKDASPSEKVGAAPYLELLKKLKETILRVGETGVLNTDEIAEAEKLLGISLKEYQAVLNKNETVNVKDEKLQLQSAAAKFKQGKKKQLVMDVRPELESYIWAINQELIREGKKQIDINTAEYLGSGYKNHAIKADGVVYKFARHTNPLAAKVNKMMGGKTQKKYEGEIAALRKLQGQNAPDFVASGDNFMAMSEAQGVTLKEALETASAQERKDLLAKAARLLKSFHQQGLVHNDFHPGNIIKKADGELAAIDWEAGKLTKNKQDHYNDRQIAISRFQDVLTGSKTIGSKEHVASLFDVAYLEDNTKEIKQNYRNMLKRLIKSGAEEANRRFADPQGGLFVFDDSGQLVDGTDLARTNFNKLAQEYRDAVKAGEADLMDDLGKTLLFQSELLKRAYLEASREVESEPELRKLRGYAGYVTSVQTEILEGNPGSKSRANKSLVDSVDYNTQLKSVVENSYLGEDVKSGVEEVLDKASGKVIGYQFVLGINEGGQEAADINSPSRVWQWIGEMIKKGFEIGVENIGRPLTEAVANMATELDNHPGLLDPLLETVGADQAVNDFFGDLINKFSSFFDDLKEKHPVLGRVSEALMSIGGELLQVLGIFSLGEAIFSFGSVALDTAMQMESLEKSIIAVSASAAEGAKNIAFVKQQARDLSIDYITAADGYKRLVGATRNTPLEGLQTEQLFSTLATTAKNRGLTTDATNRFFTGFEQIIGKNQFEREEVKGQLGDVIGDMENMLAVAVGVSRSQLPDMMQKGLLKVPDVMPKLKAVMDAQNAALGSASGTAASAQIRLNNAIKEYQDAVGRQLQPVQKMGLNALSSVLEVLRDRAIALIKLMNALVATVLVNLTLKVLAVKFAVNGVITAMQQLIGVLTSAPFLTFAGRFLLIAAAIEVWSNNIKLARNAFPDLQADIEASTKALDALKRAFDETGEAANQYGKNQPKQMQLNEGAEVGNWTPGSGKILKTIAGGDRYNWDNLFRNRHQRFYDAQVNWSTGFYKAIGLEQQTNGLKDLAARKRPTTQAQKKQADFVVGASDLIGNADSTLTYSNKARSVLDDIAKIDSKARLLQSQRLSITPGDTAKLKEATEAEAKVFKERDELLKKSAQYQESIQTQIEKIKPRLEELDQLDKTGGTEEEIAQRKATRASLEDRLGLLEDEKKAIDEINSRIPKFLSELSRILQNTDLSVKGFIGSQEDNAVVNRTEAIQTALSEGLSDAQLEVKLDNLAGKDFEDRINFVNKKIADLENKLGSASVSEGVKLLEDAAKKDGLELTPNVLEKMLTEGRSAAENEAANTLLALDEYKSIVASSQAGLVDLIKSNKSKLSEFSRTIEDYFFKINQQIKEATLETQRLISQIFYTNVKNSLRSVLAPGSNTFVNGIIDNVQSVLDQAQQVAEKVFGDQAAQLGFESETRTLATEMRDFVKQVNGASDALGEFANKLTGDNSSSSSSRSSSGGTQSGGSSFAAKTINIANKLGIDPHALMTIMLFESAGTLSPKIQGPQTKNQGRGRGLIQFMPATAKGLGTSDAALASMTPLEQLDWVEKYFAQFKGNFGAGKLENLYAAVLAGNPMAVNASDGYTTARQGAQRMMREHGAKARQLLGDGSSSNILAVPKSPPGSTTGELPPPPLIEAQAVEANEKLVAAKRQNLEYSQKITEQEREALAINALNTIELNKRQTKQALQENARSVLGLEGKFADFKNQSGYQSAQTEIEFNLRNIKQQFLDADLDIASQITNTEDAINSITNSIPVLTAEIARLKAIGTPEADLAASVQQSALSELQKTLPSLQGNLNKMKTFQAQLPGLEEQANYWSREQGKLKLEQEDIGKRSLILNQRDAILQARGTLEEQRQLKLQLEDLRVEKEINDLRLSTPEGYDRNEGILNILRQSKINKENIDYDARTGELDLEKRLLDYQSGIGEKKAGFLSRIGFNFGASKIQKDNAIAQENNRYKKELIELQKLYQTQPKLLEKFTRAATELNAVNLEAINQQFKSLGQTVEDSFVTSTQGFFNQFTTNLFDGKTERDRAQLEERLRYAEEVVGLENQYRDTPGKLAHLKNRARELNEEKLDKIRGEFNLFSRVIDLARGALLEFVKQLAQLAAQQAAAKFISSVLNIFAKSGSPAIKAGNDYGSGAGTFTASEGITVGEDETGEVYSPARYVREDINNYRSGGGIKKRKISDRLTQMLRQNAPGVAQAWNAEGEGAQLGVFHTGEELLSRKTGEAGRYQALKRMYGFNPLDKIGRAETRRFTAHVPYAKRYPLGRPQVFKDGGTVGDNILATIPRVSSPRLDLSGLSEVRGQRSEVRRAVTINTTVVTKDADSFRLNQDQMNQDLVERMRRGI